MTGRKCNLPIPLFFPSRRVASRCRVGFVVPLVLPVNGLTTSRLHPPDVHQHVHSLVDPLRPQYSSTGLPPIDDTGFSEVINGVVELDSLADALNVNAPWTASNAAELDSQTFATWMDSRNLSASARSLFEVTLTSVWSVEPAG